MLGRIGNLGRLSGPETARRRQRLYQAFRILALLLVFGAGVLVGTAYQRGRQKLDLGRFWQVYNLIDERYVGSLDASKALEGAIHGLVGSLKDPFSAYLPASARFELDQELRGEFEGIGAELIEKDGLITVVAPLEGSPAMTAGLKPNDVIIKIDSESTEDLSLSEAVAKIRGERGTAVSLTLLRQGRDEPLELKITRQAIQVKSVKTEVVEQALVITISQFGEDTIGLVRGAVEDFSRKNLKAVILDLRNNPGGYLNAVPPVAGLFMPPSTILIESYRDGRTEELRSTDLPVLPNTPVFVLVNNGSASASEILAGAFQDYGRATLIGQTTFGKGSVQDLIPLDNGAALRLTVAEWLTPKSRRINDKGLKPDIEIEADKTADSDPARARALELTRSL